MNNRYQSLDEIMGSTLFQEITEVQNKSIPENYNPEVESFLEIVNFVKLHNREPEKVLYDLNERKLASRLIGIRRNDKRIEHLKPYDDLNLLEQTSKSFKYSSINSIDDILNKGTSELLNNDQDDSMHSIFDTSSVPKKPEMPDYIARRKKISDFDKYESVFKLCQKEITEGKRKILPFRMEQDINIGDFYILNGVLLFIEAVGEKRKHNGVANARLKCVFENGTESDMLLRSLAAALYKNGRRVTDNEDNILSGMLEGDTSTGYIYILKSLSEDIQISKIKNLYKIGYTSGEVENRIRNAKNEATYLYANVEIVSTYQVYNLNISKFENTLHRMLSDRSLDVSILASNGRYIVPKEWFVASLEEIQEVINEIVIKVNTL